jgi:hypothetical protein
LTISSPKLDELPALMLTELCVVDEVEEFADETEAKI